MSNIYRGRKKNIQSPQAHTCHQIPQFSAHGQARFFIPLPLDDFEANLKHNIISFGSFKFYTHDVPHVMEDRKMFP